MQENEITIRGNEKSGKVWIGDDEIRPSESLKLRNHSPTGFSWGFPGSGPSQLALAVMLKFLPPASAVLVYQDFKHAFVKNWEGDFIVPVKDIKEWIDNKKFGIECLVEIQKPAKTSSRRIKKSKRPPAEAITTKEAA